jgi:hypothetical protein
MGQFKSMETHGVITDRQRIALPAFCSAMTKGLADMVRQLSPRITSRDIASFFEPPDILRKKSIDIFHAGILQRMDLVVTYF